MVWLPMVKKFGLATDADGEKILKIRLFVLTEYTNVAERRTDTA